MMAGIVRVLSRTLNQAALPARVAGSAEEVASSQPAGAFFNRQECYGTPGEPSRVLL